MKVSTRPELERVAADLEGARVADAEVLQVDGEWRLVLELYHRGTDDGAVRLTVPASAVSVDDLSQGAEP